MRTLDGLVNLMAHLGSARDKQAYSRFEYTEFSEAELTAAYRCWLPNKLANIIPEDMIREGRTVYVEDADPSEFADFAENVDILGNLATGYAWGRLYGGGAVYMVVGEEDPSTPLNLDTISPKNPLKALIDFGRWDVAVNLNENPRAPNYLRPEEYKFLGQTEWVHWTRVLGPFDGYRLPRREQQFAQGWGGSEVEKIAEVALQALSANASVASIMHRASALVMGVKGLLQKSASTSRTAELQRRFELAALMMSNNSFTLFDLENESPANMTTNLSGITTLISDFLSVVAAAADIPVSRFFGTAPKGLNATGEGDRRNYHMLLRGKQTRVFGPALRRLDPVVLRSVYGRDMIARYDWNPLEELSGLDQAQAASIQADTHQKYITMGVALPSMVARELQANDTYTAMTDEYVVGLEEIEGMRDDEMQDTDMSDGGATSTIVGGDVAPDSTDVEPQKTALNGAQVASLVSIVASLKSGELDRPQAVAILSTAFPTIDPTTIEQLTNVEVEVDENNTNVGAGANEDTDTNEDSDGDQSDETETNADPQ